jgi:peroxiredoxin Q/BCP
MIMATSADTPGSPVEVGNPAPDFRLPATGNKEIGLADFRDRQHVVLAFYPFDWSPG